MTLTPCARSPVAGSDTSCLPQTSSSPSASVQLNVRDTSTACQPWDLRIQDEQKPYTVVFSALGSPGITTVPMGQEEDVFTTINHRGSSNQLMGKSSLLTFVLGLEVLIRSL